MARHAGLNRASAGQTAAGSTAWPAAVGCWLAHSARHAAVRACIYVRPVARAGSSACSWAHRGGTAASSRGSPAAAEHAAEWSWLVIDPSLTRTLCKNGEAEAAAVYTLHGAVGAAAWIGAVLARLAPITTCKGVAIHAVSGGTLTSTWRSQMGRSVAGAGPTDLVHTNNAAYTQSKHLTRQ